MSSADQAAADAAELKVNKKGGTTISVKKIGGWRKAWDAAKSVAGWESKSAPRPKKTKAST